MADYFVANNTENGAAPADAAPAAAPATNGDAAMDDDIL